MNRNWIIIGIVATLILVSSIIVIPSVITALLLKFIFNLEPLSTFLTLFCVCPLFAILLLLAIIWLVLGLASLAGFQITQTWPRGITLSAISIVSALLSGLTLAEMGNIVIAHYALNPIVGGIIYFIAVILYMTAAGLAVGQVSDIKNKKWVYSVIMVIFSYLVIVGVINFYRKDNYDPRTGEPIIHITPSTGKIWRNKPANIIFDPSTGEKLVIADQKMLSSNKKISDQDLPLGPGIYSFQLSALEKTKEPITVQPDCEYSFSSSTRGDPVKQDFFLVYEDGKIIKIDRADVPVPPGPGPFQIQAGESGAYVKLLIVKK